jgi:putative endonuclease
MSWFVYMMSNRTHRLYVGETVDLMRRIVQHRNRTYPDAHTARYTFNRLVWFEIVESRAIALRPEAQIKRWRREKKVFLIQGMNPNWHDLAITWADVLRMK